MVRKYAELLILASCMFVGCAQPMNRATQGAVAGSALGAGLGAIVGNQSGDAGAGIAVGAAAGALTGALLGNAFDNSAAERDALQEKISSQERVLEENRRLIDELRRRGADVQSSRRGVVVNLPDILFEFDRAELTREAKRSLNEISEVISSAKNRTIAVEGHTDAVGTVVYNKSLSLRRAENVQRELSRHGVPSRQMTVRGYGEGKPISTNNSEAGRSRNRRVEVIIEN